MKPLYIFLLCYAIFITGLADGISAALLPLPGIGIVLGLAITFCINATMGIGLLLALSLNGMYHPRISPFGIIGGLIPGLNILPFWVGLVAAGIIYKMNAEGKNLSTVGSLALRLQSIYQSNASPFQKMTNSLKMVNDERKTVGQDIRPAQQHEQTA